jgi:DNA replication ATP-dependent helicase Dna2
MVVHVIQPEHDRMRPRTLIISDQQGFIVTFPDTLISGTVVSDSVSCIRRPVLSSRIKSTVDRNAHLLYGSMLHQYFQMVLVEGDANMEQQIQTVVQQHIEDLWCLGETEEVACVHLREMIPRFQEWFQRYLGNTPKV